MYEIGRKEVKAIARVVASGQGSTRARAISTQRKAGYVTTRIEIESRPGHTFAADAGRRFGLRRPERVEAALPGGLRHHLSRRRAVTGRGGGAFPASVDRRNSGARSLFLHGDL